MKENNPYLIKKLQFKLADMIVEAGLLDSSATNIPECFPGWMRKAFEDIDWDMLVLNRTILGIDGFTPELKALVDKEKQVRIFGLMGLA